MHVRYPRVNRFRNFSVAATLLILFTVEGRHVEIPTFHQHFENQQHFHQRSSSHHGLTIGGNSTEVANAKFLIKFPGDSGNYFNKTEGNVYHFKKPGRHICTTYKNVTTPVSTKLPYCKPIYKRYTQKCKDNRICAGVRLYYETAYKNVVTSRHTRQAVYHCCPGWGPTDVRNQVCDKPHCSVPCQNGGICIKPDLCSCPKEFTGRSCERDVDECIEQKPCDQICHNKHGGFECQCRENFLLQEDGQSCQKDSRHEEDDIPLEAKDMQYEQINQRIQKLEDILTNINLLPDKSAKEIEKMHSKIENVNKEMEIIKKETENFKEDLNSFKTDLHLIEKRVLRVDEGWKKENIYRRKINRL